MTATTVNQLREATAREFADALIAMTKEALGEDLDLEKERNILKDSVARERMHRTIMRSFGYVNWVNAMLKKLPEGTMLNLETLDIPKFIYDAIDCIIAE